MLLSLLLALAALYGGVLWLLRERKLPVLWMRIWFTLQLTLAVVTLHISCRIVSFLAYKLHLMPASTAQALCRLCKHVVFKEWFARTIPHVRTVQMPGSLPYAALQSGAVCSCHSSFFDCLQFLFIAPYSLLWRGRTFLKSSLQNLPLFGYVVRCCAHFPVYFADESSASFTVNKAKQVEVAADVEAWVRQGYSILYYPEGVMNRSPRALLEFRRGTFLTVLQHRLPLYYLVVYGNHEVWSPSLKGIPGFPADIYTYVGRYNYDPEKDDASTLAAGLREAMQGHLDDMLAMRKSRDYQPWYTASSNVSK